MDAYLNAVYKVLVWDDPKISCTILGLLHVLLWLIVQLELRVYGAIFIMVIMMLLCDWYFERKDLKAERNASSDAMRQVAGLLTGVILYLRGLRKENPAAFCIAMCGIFLCLMVVARNVSGFSLAYLTLLTVFAAPLLISRIPAEYLSNFREVVQTIGTNEVGVLAESELLPFIANKDFNEQDPDLDSLLTDKTADSVTNSLISGITSMPSYLDAEGGSLDGLEEEDLEFAIRSTVASGVSFAPGECSSDSDSDHKSMNFESSHFNRDSSSEDENCYAKGLQFSEVSRDLADTSRLQGPNLDVPADTSGAGILGNLTTLGSSLISNVLKTATGTPKRKDSDSDFEIIDSEEVDES